MTSAVATVGLTYAGVDIQLSDLSIFLEIVRGLNETPSVRGTDIIVPALEGRIARNRINDILAIELRGFVRADPSQTDPDMAKASYRENWQIVRALFASDRTAQPLVANLEDGSTQNIDARPLNIVTSYEMPGWFANISIELEGLGDWAIGGS